MKIFILNPIYFRAVLAVSRCLVIWEKKKMPGFLLLFLTNQETEGKKLAILYENMKSNVFFFLICAWNSARVMCVTSYPFSVQGDNYTVLEIYAEALVISHTHTHSMHICKCTQIHSCIHAHLYTYIETHIHWYAFRKGVNEN